MASVYLEERREQAGEEEVAEMVRLERFLLGPDIIRERARGMQQWREEMVEGWEVLAIRDEQTPSSMLRCSINRVKPHLKPVHCQKCTLLPHCGANPSVEEEHVQRQPFRLHRCAWPRVRILGQEHERERG